MTNIPNKRQTRLIYGLALVAVLAIGLAIWLWVQLQTTTQQVVEVVVTATPEPAGQPVAGVAAQAESNSPAPQSADETSAVPADQGAEEETTSENSPETTANGEAVPTPTIMDFLLSDARHFQGDADAPVTLIEFSDFK